MIVWVYSCESRSLPDVYSKNPKGAAPLGFFIALSLGLLCIVKGVFCIRGIENPVADIF